MSRRRRKPPLWKNGWLAVHPEAAGALRSAYAAGALEAIHQCSDADGWAAISNDALASEIGCSRGQIPKLLEKLSERGLLEVGDRDRHERGRYRLIHQELAALVLDSELSDEAPQNAANTAAFPTQKAAAHLPQKAAADPHQDWDRGAQNGSAAAATDVDGEGEEEREEEKDLSPETSEVDAAREASRAAAVDDDQDGISWEIPPEGARAQEGGVEEALRKLAHCQPDAPQLVANVGWNFKREFADPWGWKEWRDAWAPDFPTHLVVRVLRFVRRATPADRERLRIHLLMLQQQAVWRRAGTAA
jgi:biotin operon repressor